MHRAAVQSGFAAGLFGETEAARLGLERVPLELGDLPLAHLYLVVHRALRHVPRVAAVIDAIDALAADLDAGRCASKPTC